VNYTIRKATEAESGQIKELIHLVEINPSGLDWKRFIVAITDNGRVISCGQIKPHGKDILELASIATHPDFRNQGIAGKIIQTLLDEAPRPLYLMCIMYNGPMYKKFGFRELEYKEMPRYFQRMNNLFNLRSMVVRDDHTLLVMKLE
jgi:N-acetylglutamate synthase-like GNAT family acetyltransferase